MNNLVSITRSNATKVKYKVIKDVLKYNKVAVEIFGIKEGIEKELWDMKTKDLQNMKIELRTQIGIKRRFSYRRGI